MDEQNYTAARAHVMQLTEGWVLLIDNRTLAFQSIPALTRGMATALKRKPPKGLTPGTPVAGASTTGPSPDTQPDQIEGFNFGRIIELVRAGTLSLADFEAGLRQYAPTIALTPWGQEQVILAREAAMSHEHQQGVAAAETAKRAEMKTPEQLLSEEKADRIGRSARNRPGTPWVCPECRRASDCLTNTPTGFDIPESGVCSRCQQCLDNECPMMSREEAIAEDMDEPAEIESDEDFAYTRPGIVLNEKGEKIGYIEV